MSVFSSMKRSRRAPSLVSMSLALGASLFGAPVLVVSSAGCATGESMDGGGGEADTGATSTSTTGATNATTNSATSASVSASTGLPPTSCVPMVGATVGAECGTFVKEGAAGDGTLLKPFNSIRLAIEDGAKRIYVCTGTFYDALELPLGTEIFGAIDCENDWKWRPSPMIEERSHVVGEPGVPTLLLRGDTSLQSRVFGLRLEAPDGVTEGDSSIAAFVEGGVVRFDYVQFLSGVGTDGADGTPFIDPATEGEPGIVGSWGVDGGPWAGGAGIVHATCPGVVSGAGGPGGVINVNGGYPLAPGASSLSPLGGSGGMADEVVGDCGNGGPGDDAAPAMPGAGGTGEGNFDGGRFFGSPGTAGASGQPGGAGGGGGGNGAFSCAAPAGTCPGPSGGGGGTGGCGGAGGPGGQAGGSSFGLVSVNAAVEIAFSSFAISRGGDGGNGADGQSGGAGGIGGRGPGGALGVPKACDGGTGGFGGNGGDGGGGSGGHAVAIAYRGVIPSQNQVLFSLPGVAGVGGTGGNPGADGHVENAFEF